MLLQLVFLACRAQVCRYSPVFNSYQSSSALEQRNTLFIPKMLQAACTCTTSQPYCQLTTQNCMSKLTYRCGNLTIAFAPCSYSLYCVDMGASSYCAHQQDWICCLQTKPYMEMLLTVPFFTSLPGSARVQMVDTFMTMLAKEMVWAPLSANGNTCLPSRYTTQLCGIAVHGCIDCISWMLSAQACALIFEKQQHHMSWKRKVLPHKLLFVHMQDCT